VLLYLVPCFKQDNGKVWRPPPCEFVISKYSYVCACFACWVDKRE